MSGDGLIVSKGGSPALLAVIADAAAARAVRVAARCVEILDGARGDSVSVVEDSLWRMRGAKLAEELAAAEVGGGDLPTHLQRLVTAFQIGSADIALMHGRIGALDIGSEQARVVVTVLCEMLHAAASAIRGGGGSEMAVGVAVDDGFLMMTVRTSVDAEAVLPRDGAEAFARVRAVACLSRGVARRRSENGRLEMAFSVELAALRVLLGIVG